MAKHNHKLLAAAVVDALAQAGVKTKVVFEYSSKTVWPDTSADAGFFAVLPRYGLVLVPYALTKTGKTSYAIAPTHIQIMDDYGLDVFVIGQHKPEELKAMLLSYQSDYAQEWSERYASHV